MRCAPDNTHVWQAPNSTGYLVLYFQKDLKVKFWRRGSDLTSPMRSLTFATKALKLDQIDSATLCNAQRRGFRCLRRLHLRARWRAVGKRRVTSRRT